MKYIKGLIGLWLISGVAFGADPDTGKSPAPTGGFTLEQIMSSPFPSDLVAASSGAKVAWVLNAKGVRNIWIAEPPDYQGRPITSYQEDDGQEIAQLKWTADAQAVVYARGADFHLLRDPPNPRSLPEEQKARIWLVSLTGKPPRELGEGVSPEVSPNGERVVFINKKEVWLVKTDDREKAVKLLQLRGAIHSLRWSPDGTKLAFVSNRENHSFVGIYEFESRAIHYLDPSVDRDGNPVWSANGKQVAFIRIPTASDDHLDFGPKRKGQPWSIRIADAHTGLGRQIWRAEEGLGSVFHDLVAENQLWWAFQDHLIFPWERDGWTHLYSLAATASANQAKPDLLTPGAFEVEQVSLSADRKEVFYSSNQGDLNRRHLWRAPVAGGPPKAITSGGGLKWSPVATSDGRAVVFLNSSARRPAQAAILIEPETVKELAPVPGDFPQNLLVEPQPVIFSSSDGKKIHGQLFLPPRWNLNRRCPAVIFLHGGSRRQMLLGWHYMDYYHNAYALNQLLASRGYMVLAINYRSGTGYGMEFREALNYGATGASEFQDVLGAGLYLRGRAEVDPERIGLWGGSYGGYLTALGLSRASELFRVGVDIHGVHNWNVEIRNWDTSYDPKDKPEAAKLAFESSPMASVKSWRSPVLLIHGDDDRNVPFSETASLVEALRAQGVELQQLIFPDEVHSFLKHSSWVRAYQAAFDFLESHLQVQPHD